MSNEVAIENDATYLFVQWLGWDWNFWTMIFADIILMAAFFGIVLIVGFIGVVLDWW